MRISPDKRVPLAPMTTLELGGQARYFYEATSDEALLAAVRWAADRSHPLAILGGGSNVIVPDEGVQGLVVRIATRGITEAPSAGADAGDAAESGGLRRIDVAAGEPWENVVSYAVDNDLQGIECLTGIPGATGATPIQNVGAYGQEVGDVIESVRVLERTTLDEKTLSAAECEFSYRDSMFKRHPDRYIVLSVRFALRPGAAATIAYGDIGSALREFSGPPPLAAVRDVVRERRGKKSMLLDPDDPNRRSAGSFFTNPILGAEEAAAVIARAVSDGVVDDATSVPQYPQPDGRVKLAAGWLVERSGMAKGTRRGAVGISSAHALALVHHGGGTTQELLALADEVRAQVAEKFGVTLEREPRILTGIIA